MTKRTGRAPLAITRVRLVGFHNFVDETIEIGKGGGGHLFLLGDNGSGKTTVLDAIHLAITGGDIELNAAARVGGRRHEGRSLAGIVLRQGPDGAAREGASTAYVALELASSTEPYVIGVGLAATTLQAMVSRWGFVHRGALADVPLTISGGDGERPRTREELASALDVRGGGSSGSGGGVGASAVLARISDYRVRVAQLLFGGEAGYDRACRLLSIAKAYRELLLGTRDPAALFERFLPSPSSEVLQAVEKSLHQLDELEASLTRIEARRSYVAGVAACRAEILSLRRERARLDRIELFVRHGALEAELRALAMDRGHARSELARSADALAAADARATRAERTLHALTSSDAAGWARDLSAAERDRDARQGELLSAEASRDATFARRERALVARTDAQCAWDGARRAALEELQAATEDASRLPTLLPRCAAVTTVGELDAADEIQSALAVARAALAEAELTRRDAERSRRECGERRDADTGEGRRLLDVLRASHIEAGRLFELLEPRPSADPVHLSALEAAVAADVWHTVVTKESDLPRARALLVEHRGARLAVQATNTAEAVMAPWAQELFEPPASPLSQRAYVVLAHELIQVGPLEPPDALGGLTLRGTLVRAGDGPSLLGAVHRERVSADGARARDARTRAADAAHQAAVAARDASAAQVDRLARVQRALQGLGSSELRALELELAARRHDVEHAMESLERDEQRARAAMTSLQQIEGTLATLRAASASSDGADLAQRIASAADEARAARSERDASLQLRARWAAREAELADRAEQVQRRRDELGAQLGGARSENGVATGAQGPTDGELPTVDALDRARAELAQTERARMDELMGDGSRGLRGGPPSLGLALVGSSNGATGDGPDGVRIEDRDGSPIESVLAELDRSSVEARSLVNERTREVFDVIVVGSLARQLQRDVEHMHATVADLNRLLARASLGGLRYAFRVAPRPERAELCSLVRRMSALDPASRLELRAYLEGRRGELASKGDEPPTLLDYRRWFDYRLVMRGTTETSDETPWTRERRAAGSGGEQGVPSHLIVFALAKVTYDAANARVMPLLLDEAFQGIDAGRREGLLAFATELGLQLVVASPDQDGVVASARKTTTLFVVKDEQGDVHLTPYHYWNRAPSSQIALALPQLEADA